MSKVLQVKITVAADVLCVDQRRYPGPGALHHGTDIIEMCCLDPWAALGALDRPYSIINKDDTGFKESAWARSCSRGFFNGIAWATWQVLVKDGQGPGSQIRSVQAFAGEPSWGWLCRGSCYTSWSWTVCGCCAHTVERRFLDCAAKPSVEAVLPTLRQQWECGEVNGSWFLCAFLQRYFGALNFCTKLFTRRAPVGFRDHHWGDWLCRNIQRLPQWHVAWQCEESGHKNPHILSQNEHGSICQTSRLAFQVHPLWLRWHLHARDHLTRHFNQLWVSTGAMCMMRQSSVQVV